MGRDELARVLLGPEANGKSQGLGSVRFVVTCAGDAAEVLKRSREVLEALLRHAREPWPLTEEWHAVLPAWFVDRCAAETSQGEAERRINLPIEERRRLEEQEGWSLSSWLYWFEPEQRCWSWWDATVADPNRLLVAVEVREWPFPWGALAWLFRAAGALSVEAAS